MEITVEDLSIKLIDKLYDIEKQCFDKEAFSKQQITYLIRDYNSIGLAASADKEVVGFVIARVDIHRNMRFGHILTVDVSPAYRRMGIARKLLTQIEELLKQKGATECRLEVRENNAAALSLYGKLGYKKVGRLERYYGDTHGLYLRKILP
jgi:ribosomal-protein-alanine acetyltransferase